MSVPREAQQLVQEDPNVILGWERGIRVLAVGYFAEDDTDVHCVHKADDTVGARRCAEALREVMPEA